MKETILSVMRLDKEALLPIFATPQAACMDLYSNQSIMIPAWKQASVGTGIAIEIEAGYEGLVRMRSGLASKGLMLMNGVGTIDADYRGEIKLIIRNTDDYAYHIKRFDRIAQLAIREIPNVYIRLIHNLSWTERGQGGLGSTGV